MERISALWVITLLAIVAGCSSPSEYHCYKNTGANRTETSPMLRNETFCFDSAKSCQKFMDRETCFASGPIEWHCFPGDPKRADEPDSSCYPTKAICDSSRDARIAHWPGFENVDACTPQPEVYCVAGLLGCTATKEDCRIATTAIGAVEGSDTCRLKRNPS